MPLCHSLSNGEMMNKNWWIRAFVSVLTTSWLWQPFDINSICCESGPLPLFWYLLLLISLFRKLSKIMLWKNYSSILLPKVYRSFEMHKTNLSSLIRLYLLLWPIKMFKIISHIFLAVQTEYADSSKGEPCDFGTQRDPRHLWPLRNLIGVMGFKRCKSIKECTK